MEFSDYISLIAVAFSFLALLLSVWNGVASRRMAETNLYLARYHNVEMHLASWPDALRFYGIDVNEAKEKNISPEMITYLILYVNSVHAKCKANGSSFKVELAENEMRQRIILNTEAVLAWQFARNAFGGELSKEIDSLISEKAVTKSSGGPAAA